MNISTLEFIHKMLLDDVGYKERLWRYTSEKRFEAKEQYESGTLKEAKFKEADDEYKHRSELYFEAKHALDDFEAQDF